jgi:hypothetical protein
MAAAFLPVHPRKLTSTEEHDASIALCRTYSNVEEGFGGCRVLDSNPFVAPVGNCQVAQLWHPAIA